LWEGVDLRLRTECSDFDGDPAGFFCEFWVYNKRFELMLTRRAKAYSSSGSVVTHCSTNRARCRVTSFQP